MGSGGFRKTVFDGLDPDGIGNDDVGRKEPGALPYGVLSAGEDDRIPAHTVLRRNIGDPSVVLLGLLVRRTEPLKVLKALGLRSGALGDGHGGIEDIEACGLQFVHERSELRADVFGVLLHDADLRRAIVEDGFECAGTDVPEAPDLLSAVGTDAGNALRKVAQRAKTVDPAETAVGLEVRSALILRPMQPVELFEMLRPEAAFAPAVADDRRRRDGPGRLLLVALPGSGRDGDAVGRIDPIDIVIVRCQSRMRHDVSDGMADAPERFVRMDLIEHPRVLLPVVVPDASLLPVGLGQRVAQAHVVEHPETDGVEMRGEDPFLAVLGEAPRMADENSGIEAECRKKADEIIDEGGEMIRALQYALEPFLRRTDRPMLGKIVDAGFAPLDVRRGADPFLDVDAGHHRGVVHAVPVMLRIIGAHLDREIPVAPEDAASALGIPAGKGP